MKRFTYSVSHKHTDKYVYAHTFIYMNLLTNLLTLGCTKIYIYIYAHTFTFTHKYTQTNLLVYIIFMKMLKYSFTHLK